MGRKSVGRSKKRKFYGNRYVKYNFREMTARGFQDHKDEAFLIELVRQHPPLWNTADGNYLRKSVRRRLFTEIAEKLKQRLPDRSFTADSVRHKFNTLRSYFHKEVRKMKMLNETSSVRYISKWTHFNKMLFLTGGNESDCDLNISIERVEGGLRNDDKEMDYNDSDAETSCSDSNKGRDSSLSSQPFLQSNNEAFGLSLKKEILDDSSLACDAIMTETAVNAFVAETSCSYGNVETDSSFSLQLSMQSNEEAVKASVKMEVPNDSSPMCVSFMTENPVNAIVSETSCSDRNEETDSSLSLQPSEQTNEDVEPSLKIRQSNNPSPMCGLVEMETPVLLNVLPAFNVGAGNLGVSSLNRVPIEKAIEPMKEMPPNKAVGLSLKKKNPNYSSPMHDSLNSETSVNSIVTETSCSDNEGTDSFLLLKSFVQSYEEPVESPLKRKTQSNSTPVCDSTETETPITAAIAETRCFNSNEGTGSSLSLQLKSLQSNEKTTESPAKRKKLLILRRITSQERRSLPISKGKKISISSPVCDSTETKIPVTSKTWSASPQGAPTFNVAMGNLVAASLNQMPLEKANTATKEIFDILMKYGSETNHPI